MLECRVEGLRYELRVREIRLAEKDRYIAELEQRVEELKQQAMPGSDDESSLSSRRSSSRRSPPPFVKPDLPKRRRRKRPGRKRPGRKDGHEPALRPMPRKIDQHQDVPLKMNDRHRPICPRCA